MSVTAHISVPPNDFVLGRTLREHESIHVEIERVVPLGEDLAPYVWVGGVPEQRVERTLRRDEDVEQVEMLDQVRDEILLRVSWTHRPPPLFEALVAMDATCLEVTARNGAWILELRFPSNEALSGFYEECVDRGVGLTVKRISHHAGARAVSSSERLSTRQYETLRVAFETGYFAIPRETTLQELANRLGISDTATSQRIRRGLRTLLAEQLATPVAGSPDRAVGGRQ